MGRQVHRTVHAGIWANQLRVRFSYILCSAVFVRRWRDAVSDGLVHRVDHDPGSGGLRDPDTTTALSERPHLFLAAMALGVIAVAMALPLLPVVGRWVGVRGAAAAVLRLPDRRDTGVS